jgi:hypothetical protein
MMKLQQPTLARNSQQQVRMFLLFYIHILVCSFDNPPEITQLMEINLGVEICANAMFHFVHVTGGVPAIW